MKKAGYSYYMALPKRWLTYEDRNIRLNFAEAHKDLLAEWWFCVLFSDEVHISRDHQGRIRVLRRRGERDRLDKIQYKKKQNPTLWHCWGMVGWNYKSPSVIYGSGQGKGNITQQMYRNEILEQYVLPAFRQYQQEGRGFLLEEDSAASRGTCSQNNCCRRFKDEHGIPHYNNPPRSPDLSPIENVWRAMKQRLQKRR